MSHIPRIAVTGGCCAGKSTILNLLRQKLEDLGWQVFLVPETATDFVTSGITPDRYDDETFQVLLLEHLIAREEQRFAAAQAAKGDKKVILCDRGAIDAAAYMPELIWRRVLARAGTTLVDLRDRRYDGVLFLRSVAVDAPHLYTRANNPARRESLEEAIALDQRTHDVWIGCPHLRVIDNSTDLDGKAHRAFQAVCRVLGIPEPLEIERKYEVRGFDPCLLPAHAQPVHIVQYYLRSARPDEVERVRARGQGGTYVYYHTTKTSLREAVRTETEQQVSRAEYEELLRRADPARRPIEKTRTCFVWENQYFELDTFISPRGVMLLEIELTKEQDTVILPPFLEDCVRDVTDDPAFSNYALARAA